MEEYLLDMMGEDDPDPSPDQIKNLETLIREHPGNTQMELWKKLPCPQEMSYTTFGHMICAFVRIKKVAVDEEGHYCWIYNPDQTHKFLSQPILLIK
jgi:hypothetical protein